MDSIGFDVRDLKAYVEKIKANGATFDVPYGRDPELGLMSATVTDPWGVTIRLTEGLNKAAGMTSYSYVGRVRRRAADRVMHRQPCGCASLRFRWRACLDRVTFS
jgi:hypothetical protein